MLLFSLILFWECAIFSIVCIPYCKHVRCWVEKKKTDSDIIDSVWNDTADQNENRILQHNCMYQWIGDSFRIYQIRVECCNKSKEKIIVHFVWERIKMDFVGLLLAFQFEELVLCSKKCCFDEQQTNFQWHYKIRHESVLFSWFFSIFDNLKNVRRVKPFPLQHWIFESFQFSFGNSWKTYVRKQPTSNGCIQIFTYFTEYRFNEHSFCSDQFHFDNVSFHDCTSLQAPTATAAAATDHAYR